MIDEVYEKSDNSDNSNIKKNQLREVLATKYQDEEGKENIKFSDVKLKNRDQEINMGTGDAVDEPEDVVDDEYGDRTTEATDKTAVQAEE